MSYLNFKMQNKNAIASLLEHHVPDRVFHKRIVTQLFFVYMEVHTDIFQLNKIIKKKELNKILYFNKFSDTKTLNYQNL